MVIPDGIYRVGFQQGSEDIELAVGLVGFTILIQGGGRLSIKSVGGVSVYRVTQVNEEVKIFKLCCLE